jgi:hypothetical protein
MATLNERVSALEDSLHNDFAVPFQSVMLVLDQHTVQLDKLAQSVQTQGRDINELKLAAQAQGRDMFEMKKRMSTIETRMNNMDENFEMLQKNVSSMRGEVNQGNQKLDQILVLLLPKKE